MGKRDAITKEYMSKPHYFADAFNSSVFNGKQIVKADNLSLQEMDPTEMGIIITEDAKDITQKVRDVLKKSIIMNDGKMAYILLGIENQSEIHYAMPVKNLIYDALNYGQQVNKIAVAHRKEKDVKSAEFLSGFSKSDKIMPVITLTVYFGGNEWDAPRSLKDMFQEDLDEEILKEVDDYKLHLIIPTEIKDFSVFQTDFGKAMKYIAASESTKKIMELSKDSAFEKVSSDTVHLINACTNSNITVPVGEETINMCKGLEGYGEMKREEGLKEGLEEGRMTSLIELVAEGHLEKEIAAQKLGMSVEEFTEEMKKVRC